MKDVNGVDEILLELLIPYVAGERSLEGGFVFKSQIIQSLDCKKAKTKLEAHTLRAVIAALRNLSKEPHRQAGHRILTCTSTRQINFNIKNLQAKLNILEGKSWNKEHRK